MSELWFDVERRYKTISYQNIRHLNSCGLMQKDDIRQSSCIKNEDNGGCGLMQKDDIRQFDADSDVRL